MTQAPPSPTPPPTPPPTPEKQPCAQESRCGVRRGRVVRRVVQRRVVQRRPRARSVEQQVVVNENLVYLLVEGFVSRLASVDHFNAALLRLLEALLATPRDPRLR